MRKTHTSDTGYIYMTLEKTKALPQSGCDWTAEVPVSGRS